MTAEPMVDFEAVSVYQVVEVLTTNKTKRGFQNDQACGFLVHDVALGIMYVVVFKDDDESLEAHYVHSCAKANNKESCTSDEEEYTLQIKDFMRFVREYLSSEHYLSWQLITPKWLIIPPTDKSYRFVSSTKGPLVFSRMCRRLSRAMFFAEHNFLSGSLIDIIKNVHEDPKAAQVAGCSIIRSEAAAKRVYKLVEDVLGASVIGKLSNERDYTLDDYIKEFL